MLACPQKYATQVEDTDIRIKAIQKTITRAVMVFNFRYVDRRGLP